MVRFTGTVGMVGTVGKRTKRTLLSVPTVTVPHVPTVPYQENQTYQPYVPDMFGSYWRPLPPILNLANLWSHTCSETSYRITDVECAARAKTLQLNLTGTIWVIRNEKLCEGKTFYVLARRICWFWCSSGRLRKTVQLFGLKKHFEKRRAGSGLSRLPFREMINWCRYAELIKLCITTNWQCLRWAVSVSRALPPCCDKLITDTKTKFHKKHETSKLEVLHLFRCIPHTRLAAARLFFGNCGIGSEALIWALKQDIAINARSKYRGIRVAQNTFSPELSDSIADVGKRFHVLSLQRQVASGLCQVASKVGQVCCRKDLDRVSCWVSPISREWPGLPLGHCWECFKERWPADGSDSVPMRMRHGQRGSPCLPYQIPAGILGFLPLGSRCWTLAGSDTNFHLGTLQEFGNADASNWPVGWLVPKSQSIRFDQHGCDQWSHWRRTPVACFDAPRTDPLPSP